LFIPVLTHSARFFLISGVRHIVGFLEWDSFAKAAWLDETIQRNQLSLTDIMKMIGDENRTTPRMLAGYRLVKQFD
jgi:hypothetical protein